MPVFRILVIAAFCIGSAVGEDKPAVPQFTYRVLGLFSLEREKDLRKCFQEMSGMSVVGINFDDAEITLAFRPEKQFPGTKPDQVLESLDQKLRQLSHHTFGIKPRRMTPRDKLEKVDISVVGLDCQACCLAVYEAVAKIDGVEQAAVSLRDGKLSALIDPKKTDRAKLEEPLNKLGVLPTKP